MEPLPCPFCGKPVRVFNVPFPDGDIIWANISHYPPYECGVSFVGDQATIVAKWNNYQNTLKEYHRMFSEKFKRAERQYYEQKMDTSND